MRLCIIILLTILGAMGTRSVEVYDVGGYEESADAVANAIKEVNQTIEDADRQGWCGGMLCSGSGIVVPTGTNPGGTSSFLYRTTHWLTNHLGRRCLLKHASDPLYICSSKHDYGRVVESDIATHCQGAMGAARWIGFARMCDYFVFTLRVILV